MFCASSASHYASETADSHSARAGHAHTREEVGTSLQGKGELFALLSRLSDGEDNGINKAGIRGCYASSIKPN